MFARLALTLVLAASGVITASGRATAQGFPGLELIVPSAAAGPTDMFGRVLAISLGDELRQSVVVLNKPGAAATAAAFERAPPNGYTLLFWNSTVNALRGMRAAAVATVAVQGSVIYGVVAPSGTPDAIVVHLNSAINKTLENSQVRSMLDKLGAEPKASTPQEAAILIGTKQ